MNIEAYALGVGIRIFSESDFEAKLKLLRHDSINSEIIQFHYKVLK